jgi:hypothetical protein
MLQFNEPIISQRNESSKTTNVVSVYLLSQLDFSDKLIIHILLIFTPTGIFYFKIKYQHTNF